VVQGVGVFERVKEGEGVEDGVLVLVPENLVEAEPPFAPEPPPPPPASLEAALVLGEYVPAAGVTEERFTVEEGDEVKMVVREEVTEALAEGRDVLVRSDDGELVRERVVNPERETVGVKGGEEAVAGVGEVVSVDSGEKLPNFLGEGVWEFDEEVVEERDPPGPAPVEVLLREGEEEVDGEDVGDAVLSMEGLPLGVGKALKLRPVVGEIEDVAEGE